MIKATLGILLLLTMGFAGPDLVGEWHFDEGSGATSADTSGYGNTGTLNGNATWNTTGKFSYGMHLNGTTNDYISVADNNNIDLGSSLTMEAWVKFDDFYTGPCQGNVILGKGDDGAIGWYTLSLSGDSCGAISPNHYLLAGIHTTTAGYGALAYSVNISKNTWYHVAGTWDGSNLKIYINGTLYNTTSATGTLTANAQSLYFGHHNNIPSYPYPLNGTIDEIRIYNRTLSAAEIKAHANCNYDQNSGNWHIDGKEVLCRAKLNLTGNLSVSSNSNFTLEYATLNFNSTGTSLATGAYGWDINGSGDNVLINSSTITRSNNNVNSWMYVINANFSAYNSTFNIGGATGDFNRRGIWVAGSYLFTFIGNRVENNTGGGFGIMGQNIGVSGRVATIANNIFNGNSFNLYLFGGNNESKIFDNTFSNGYGISLDAAGGGGAVNVSTYNNNYSNTGNDVYINDESTSTLCANLIAVNSQVNVGSIANGSGGGCEARNSIVSINTNNTQNTYIWGNYTINTLNSNQTFSPAQDGSLVGQWRFEEWPVGSTIQDYSGNGNSGTLANGPGQALGKLGWGYTFDGVNDYVNISDSASLDIAPNSAVTIAAWIYPTSFQNEDEIVQKGIVDDCQNYGLNIFLLGGIRKLLFASSNACSAANAGNNSIVVLNQWQHVAVTVSGTTANYYINGVRTDTVTLTGGIGAVNTAPLVIGGGPSQPYVDYFNGTIDDVSIWNRSLSAYEIAALAGRLVWANRNVTLNGNTYYTELRVTNPNITWYNVSFLGNTTFIVDGNSGFTMYGGNLTTFRVHMDTATSLFTLDSTLFNSTTKLLFVDYWPAGLDTSLGNFTTKGSSNSYVIINGSTTQGYGFGGGGNTPKFNMTYTFIDYIWSLRAVDATYLDNVIFDHGSIGGTWNYLHTEGGAWTVKNTEFRNPGGYGSILVFSQRLSNFTNITFTNSGTNNHIRWFTNAYKGQLQLINSSFNESRVEFNGATNVAVLSKDHNRTAGDYFIMSAGGNRSYLTMGQDFGLTDNVRVNGSFLINSNGDFKSLNVTSVGSGVNFTNFFGAIVDGFVDNRGNITILAGNNVTLLNTTISNRSITALGTGNLTSKWRNIKIVDENGNAVASATVKVNISGVVIASGTTDINGILIANVTDYEDIGETFTYKQTNITVSKAAYDNNDVLDNVTYSEYTVVLAPSGGGVSGFSTGHAVSSLPISTTQSGMTIQVGSTTVRGPWQGARNVTVKDSSGNALVNITHNFSQNNLPLNYLKLETGSGYMGISGNYLSVIARQNKTYTIYVPVKDAICNTQVCSGVDKLRDSDCSSSDWSTYQSAKLGNFCVASVSGTVVRDQADLTSIVSVPELDIVWILIIFLVSIGIFARLDHEK